ncbi:MAG TPA: M23 family metallopeptidase [Sandaracinaceae bacterium LLY-WYZ-13_1]|nr:M23 family metallopeptidase [Sandaracinaceae bacterium LLY-WYZ-13_1]
MRHTSSLCLCLVLAGCTAQLGTPIDDGDHDPGLGVVEDAVSCAARLERHPVAGPHNHGWDSQVSVFTCDGARANTDYYRGGSPTHPTGHLGNDIFAARGTPIVAARGGRVSYVRDDAVGGLNVGVVDDCGWTQYYAHLDAIEPTLRVGQRVRAGDPIGAMGDTGSARGTPVHLHFSVYPDGNYRAGIDPFGLLGGRHASACDAGSEPGAEESCGDLARRAGYAEPACEWNGNGACGGRGPTTPECDHCCDRALLDAADADPPSTLPCGEVAARLGFAEPACEWNGNGACGGHGPSSADCDHCCDRAAPERMRTFDRSAGASCGGWADDHGYDEPACEWNGNGACGGRGPATADCDHCCDLAAVAPARGDVDFELAGHALSPAQEGNLRYVASEVVPRLAGPRAQRLQTAAVVAWWALKEGVFSIDAPFGFSLCNFPGGDRRIGPLEVCPAGRAWQVGPAAVQVPGRSLATLEAEARRGGREPSAVLDDVARRAGHAGGSSTHRAIVASSGALRRSWLLRDGAIGFALQAPTVRAECVEGARRWCYGTGWRESRAFAPSRAAALATIDEVETLLASLAP